jgi:hypothetical protein
MRLSRKDVFFLSIRLTIIVYLIISTGVAFAVISLVIFNLVNMVVMKYAFDLEAVAPVDTLLVHDDEKNIANIVCNLFILKKMLI